MHEVANQLQTSHDVSISGLPVSFRATKNPNGLTRESCARHVHSIYTDKAHVFRKWGYSAVAARESFAGIWSHAHDHVVFKKNALSQPDRLVEAVRSSTKVSGISANHAT